MLNSPPVAPRFFYFRDSSFLAALEISSMTLHFRYVPGKGYKKLYLWFPTDFERDLVVTSDENHWIIPI